MRPVGLFIYMEKPDYLIRIVRLPIDATSKDAMKLRMTGFERSPSFVIRLGNKPPQINEDGARHQTAKLVSVFHKNLMSFPINFDVVFFLSNSLVLFL